jgi:hypothetical protein
VATRVLVVWLARDAGASTVAARVAASALDAWLRRVSGVETLAHDSGAFGKSTWASVALRVAPEVVPGLPALLAQAGRGVDASVLNEALAHASEQDRALEARAGSQLDSSAERLARERLLGGQSAAVSGKPEDATSVARALLSTAPTYLSLD